MFTWFAEVTTNAKGFPMGPQESVMHGGLRAASQFIVPRAQGRAHSLHVTPSKQVRGTVGTLAIPRDYRGQRLFGRSLIGFLEGFFQEFPGIARRGPIDLRTLTPNPQPYSRQPMSLNFPLNRDLRWP